MKTSLREAKRLDKIVAEAYENASAKRFEEIDLFEFDEARKRLNKIGKSAERRREKAETLRRRGIRRDKRLF